MTTIDNDTGLYTEQIGEDSAGADMSMSIMERFWASYYVVADKETPLLTRILPLVALGYLFSPIDLIPDFLIVMLGLGVMDDFGVLAYAFWRVQKAIRPKHISMARRKLGRD